MGAATLASFELVQGAGLPAGLFQLLPERRDASLGEEGGGVWPLLRLALGVLFSHWRSLEYVGEYVDAPVCLYTE